MAETNQTNYTDGPSRRELILLAVLVGIALAYGIFLLTTPEVEEEAEPDPQPAAQSENNTFIVRCGSEATAGEDQETEATGFIVEQVDGVLEVTTFHHDQPVQVQSGEGLICTVTLEDENEPAAG
jgi:hypothetical protein